MINELYIKNYALIEEEVITFSEGLNILSGETGAGKSVLIGALGLILGAKGENSFIRTGAEESEISARFSNLGPLPLQWLSQHGIESTEELIITRKLRKSGRGSVYLQSRPFPLSELSELGSLLVDLHGQHDHQSLFLLENHRKLLDQSGHLQDQVDKVSQLYDKLKETSVELKELEEQISESKKNKELNEFALNEILEGDISLGEEERIYSNLKKIEHSQLLFESIDSLLFYLSKGDNAAISSMQVSQTYLNKIGQINEDFQNLEDRFSNVFYELEDIVESIKDEKNKLDFSPEERDQLEERYSVIRGLLKKYGPRFEDLELRKKTLQESLELSSTNDSQLKTLREQYSLIEKELIERAKKLSLLREKEAALLESKVLDVLFSLGLPNANFKVLLERRIGEKGQYLCGPNGFDKIEFLFNANKGEFLKPLKQVASGGEISRVMLSIKTALAEADQVPTLIFDEIDAGIGGEIAPSLAIHLKGLSHFHQILCITHLASIAVYADTHIKVEKRVNQDRTSTRLITLKEEDKVGEIARMLSGDPLEFTSLEHARVLLENARQKG